MGGPSRLHIMFACLSWYTVV